MARTLTDALNRGDSAAARAVFAPTARFDSVGRIYPDRDAIFDRFIDPEVIALGGRYTELSSRTDGDRLVVEYNFTTRSGGREHFTYAYRIQDGVITDVIGRYV
ncbi:nuclear transport factor 2 family protein [Micromonospora sp. STR1s_5]|nr:nuclear transport factor 2 family protein [Micromonospora sp. STR1s_5]